jgi:hypothetical protein
VDATIQRTTASLGSSVVVHLQRFKPNMRTLTWEKNSRHVHFPLVIDAAALRGEDKPIAVAAAGFPGQEAVETLSAAFPKVPVSVIRAVLDSTAGDANTASMLLEEGVFMEPSLLQAALPVAPEATAVQQYELVGVVTHHGHSMHGGHYTAYVRSTSGSSLWLHCNDSVVEVASEAQVLQCEAYMLFYQAR